MKGTAEQQAWADGRGAGEMLAEMLQQGRTWGETMRAVEPESRTPQLFAAWLSGFGQGISDTAGCIPGHHLAGVVRFAGGLRTELVPDR